MSRRELAWRVLSRELELSTEEERGTGERAASYLISPLGARMNRVLVAGTLSAPEPIGRDEPSSFWRARVTDPLGELRVTAGSFQPRAMAQLRAAVPDRPALVLGKVHLFRGRDGSAVVSLRAEAVRSVPEAEERAALADAVRQTLDRLDLIDRLRHEPAVADAALRREGYPTPWIAAAREAIRRYPDADRTAVRSELGRAVVRVRGGLADVPTELPATVRRTVDPPPVALAPLDAAQAADAAAFLDLVDAGAVRSEDGYADVREVLRRLAERGIAPERAEVLLGRLEEGGVLEEPIVGKLRRA